ncbi:carboxypeptidase-like regulatory domain-containing protein [Chondromyces crocatus]|uniref:Carboxypeptidase regulatory-like domain-containing protein n=1 Tax=Chondromyces crocatus TaxID=52 RepID=A0A0K1ETF9_CHOCO|nr:carboxypeptidase-like regulatory domain-containing protein [Chondromyces crocatus]AKT43923.1 uncharacterized protein CMC5_081600 [Chondromyces crocatus]
MKTWSLRAGLIVAAAAVPAVVPGWGCSEMSQTGTTEGVGGNSGQGGAGDGGQLFPMGVGGNGGAGPCHNLECQVVQCSGGAKTTVSGVVYEPAGRVPLYNVTVYVPNAPLAPIEDGASCDTCAANLSGKPVAAALTGTDGRFVLEDVPVGENIPLVIQVGKWRREFVLPAVAACVDTPMVDGDLHLPRNQSEGNIPLIALTTGGADALECLVRKMGIDDEEFTSEGGAGRVHLFTGVLGTERFADGLHGGEELTPATNLWNTLDGLMRYDVAILSCEGAQYAQTKPESARRALMDYTAAGGRVFASHWHNIWLQLGPDPWPRTATWDFQLDPGEPFTSHVDMSFPKGQALSEWLMSVDASDTPGELQIRDPQHTISAVNEELTTRWTFSEAPEPAGVQYFTFNTPLTQPDGSPMAPENQCGRVVYTDIHVSSGDYIGHPFPSGCITQELSPQEKVLMFMLFDLSACVTPDDQAPPIPQIQ